MQYYLLGLFISNTLVMPSISIDISPFYTLSYITIFTSPDNYD